MLTADVTLGATTCAAGPLGECPPSGSSAEAGLTPNALLVLRYVNARFGPHAYAGVGDRPDNPSSDHPHGRAVDIMIENWSTATGIAEGTAIAEWVRAHAEQLGVTYIIWRARIWSAGDTDWRPYRHPSGATDSHLDAPGPRPRLSRTVSARRLLDVSDPRGRLYSASRARSV